MTDETVELQFRWFTYRPDQRQYRQQSVELEPQYLNVTVPVPKNLVTIDDVEISLSLEGLKYVLDMFDNLLTLEPVKSQKASDDDLGDDESEKDAPSFDDEWNDDKSTPNEATWEDSGDEWN